MIEIYLLHIFEIIVILQTKLSLFVKAPKSNANSPVAYPLKSITASRAQ